MVVYGRITLIIELMATAGLTVCPFFIIFELSLDSCMCLSSTNCSRMLTCVSILFCKIPWQNIRELQGPALCMILPQISICIVHDSVYGYRREKTCLRGVQQSEFQTSLLSYRDQLEN